MPLDKIQTGSVKKKILFIFVIFALALILAYIISTAAFKNMLVRVDRMTSPNEKIVLVNQISQRIMSLDRTQREQMLMNSKSDFEVIQAQHIALNSSLTKLKQLFAGNSMQITRVDSIQSLIQGREKEMEAFILARQNLDKNPMVQQEIRALGQLMEASPEVQKPAPATVTPAPSPAKESKRKNLFSWLFGTKKEDNQPPSTVQDSVSLKTPVDRAEVDIKPEILDVAIRRIQEEQTKTVNEFILSDIRLLETGNIVWNQVFDILQIVEKDALKQADLENVEARSAVRQSVNRIILVFVIFLLVIAIMIYFVLSDIRKSNTYRIALEEAKDAAEYHAVAKQKFLSNMSHELRTPLQSIIGFTEQLKNRYQDDSMIKTIQQSSEHLLYIVNEVLDFNRIDSGKIILKEQPLNLDETVRDVIHTIQPLAIQKNLKLEYRIAVSRRVWVLGDAFRIRQILFNLLSNAIKFTHEGKVVLDVSGKNFSSANESDSSQDRDENILHVKIQVKDTGVGISDRDMARIFEHFEQVDHVTNSPQNGSGLGLSIVKGILESMVGEVSVSSEKNKGSIFTAQFHLKIYHAPELKEEIISHSNVVDQPQIGLVWLVDDDPLIRDLCQTIFENNAIPHKIFSDPQAMLDEAVDPDLRFVLMDIRMPKMNGFQLHQQLRKKIRSSQTKLIAFTAQALPEEQTTIINMGFDGILLKPFREMDLFHILGRKEVKTSVASEFIAMQNSPEILELLRRETKEDVALLRMYYDQKDMAALSLVFHRLAGRLSQFGETKLSFDLRKFEIDTRADEYPVSDAFEKLIINLEYFLENVQLSPSRSR